MNGGAWYHIYLPPTQRVIFPAEDAYRAFLANYANIDLKTLAYCLLPDHFHFLVWIERWQSAELKLRPLFTLLPIVRPITRVKLADGDSINPLIRYIHANPTTHAYTDNFRTWQWSSYRAVLAQRPTQVAVRDVLQRFYGVEWFEEQHWLPIDEAQIGYLILDD
jgi:hypothetical protein